MMIEIIDKINKTIEKVENLEIVIHPSTNQVLFLEDYQKKGKAIYGVIFDTEGTLFYYKKC
ncbi:hypothetical protein QKV40_gp02 [Varidnaviria sp.]|uniref:Uncharacterized protein n=1 Tax=Lokiarchaeia virus SkuldV1 TaxID=3058189 RepID=A0AA46RIC0_9VIRU|nr:hypothetical protein QKV40_gp02 [Varidnaviria sp.]UPO70956.1 hypothetical protein 11324_00002 [Lokiarchaeia virus SkuldV1]